MAGRPGCPAPTGALAMAAVALLAIWTYTGSAPALVAGYILGTFAASVFAPAAGALTNELFPTSVRASAAGWSLAAGVLGAVIGLVAFGALAAPGNRFLVASLITFLPPTLLMALFWLLPETRGRDGGSLARHVSHPPAGPCAADRVAYDEGLDHGDAAIRPG